MQVILDPIQFLVKSYNPERLNAFGHAAQTKGWEQIGEAVKSKREALLFLMDEGQYFATGNDHDAPIYYIDETADKIAAMDLVKKVVPKKKEEPKVEIVSYNESKNLY